MTTDQREVMGTANCQTCLLADVMKDCPNCEFYPYKIFRTLARIKALKADYPAELRDARIKALQNKQKEILR